MGWLDDVLGITDDVLSTVTKPTKAVTGAVKETVEDILDDIFG